MSMRNARWVWYPVARTLSLAATAAALRCGRRYAVGADSLDGKVVRTVIMYDEYCNVVYRIIPLSSFDSGTTP